jgi:hypothetical protein
MVCSRRVPQFAWAWNPMYPPCVQHRTTYSIWLEMRMTFPRQVRCGCNTGPLCIYGLMHIRCTGVSQDVLDAVKSLSDVTPARAQSRFIGVLTKYHGHRCGWTGLEDCPCEAAHGYCFSVNEARKVRFGVLHQNYVCNLSRVPVSRAVLEGCEAIRRCI